MNDSRSKNSGSEFESLEKGESILSSSKSVMPAMEQLSVGLQLVRLLVVSGNVSRLQKSSLCVTEVVHGSEKERSASELRWLWGSRWTAGAPTRPVSSDSPHGPHGSCDWHMSAPRGSCDPLDARVLCSSQE
jgi:hypothetical protein